MSYVFYCMYVLFWVILVDQELSIADLLVLSHGERHVPVRSTLEFTQMCLQCDDG
jgi:hypothetical protein